MTSKLYTTQEVAKMLGVHIYTVRAYIHKGKLDAHNIGGMKITEESIQRFLDQTKVHAVAVEG